MKPVPTALTSSLRRLLPAAQALALVAAGLVPLAAWPAGGHDSHAAAPAAAGKAQPRPIATVSAASAAAEPAAPAAAAEPMDRLRQRLAERLSDAAQRPAGANSATLDVHVSTGSAVGAHKAVKTTALRSGHGASGHGAGSTAKAGAAGHGAAHAPHWAYEGAAGPAAWGGLKPEFATCANGQRQSPIDIRGGLPVELEPVKFDYQPSRFAVIDNGHTVQVNLPPGNAIEVGGKRYELVQFHFHRPSEERIDGRQFELSLHLVHKNAEGKLAVVGVLLEKGPAHPVVQQVWNNLPLERNEENASTQSLDPATLLPSDRRYFTYMGSLTTPPCSEGVLWVVMRTPVSVTQDQVNLFARIYPNNARPVQSASGRRIIQSN